MKLPVAGVRVTQLFLVMFGSVKNMVSAFETRKQPHPPPPSHSSPTSSTQNLSTNQQNLASSTTHTPVLKTLPCLSTTPEPHSPHTSGPHVPTACMISHPVTCERHHDGERERKDVMLRRGEEGRRMPRVRLRDSWPMGNLNCFERTFLSFVTLESKEPISSFKCPPEFDRSRLRPIGCKSTSMTGLNITSTTGLNTISTTRPSITPTTGLNTTSTTGLNPTSSKGLNTTPTTALKTTYTTRLSSSSALNTTASANVNVGASANSNSLSLGRHHPVLVGDANKSVFKNPGVPVYPNQLGLANAATVNQIWGRDQEKGRAFQPQIGVYPSDAAFSSLLLLLHSGSSNSMIAIDNKIEQAMDLVKAHLMLAVREEVEVLREQIKELTERNVQLEKENYILRALRENQ